LLFLFSSVSVEIALWSHVFLWLVRWFFPCWNRLFSKNLCYGTLYCPWMSINVNVFLELVGLVTFYTDRVQCRDRNLPCFDKLFKRFHADPGWIAHCLIMYMCFGMCAVTSSITMAYFLIIQIHRCFGFMCAVTSSITVEVSVEVVNSHDSGV
jgi:hypothetical protein